MVFTNISRELDHVFIGALKLAGVVVLMRRWRMKHTAWDQIAVASSCHFNSGKRLTHHIDTPYRYRYRILEKYTSHR